MVSFALAFIFGQFLSGPVSVSAGAAVAAGILWWLFPVRAHRLELVTRLLTASLAGAYLAQPPVPAPGCFIPLVPEKVWIEATVRNAKLFGDQRLMIESDAIVLRGDQRPVCGVLRLTVADSVETPTAGARWELHATLRRPRNFANPGAVDGVGALRRRGIFVVGWAHGSRVRELASGGSSRLEEIRLTIRQRIDSAVAVREAKILGALVLGEAAEVPGDVRQAITDAGLAHVLAVSGLHVGLVWAVAAWAFNALGSRSEWLLLHVNVRGFSAVLATLPAGCYVALAGGRIPAQRAALMVMLTAAALAGGRETRALRMIAVAALGVLVVRPGAVFEISFQLSFVAVVAIVLVSGGAAFASRLSMLFLISAAAFVGTAPLVVFHFHRIAPAALLTNPLFVPLLAVPATLLGLAGGSLSLLHAGSGELLLWGAGLFAAWLADATAFVASLPGASFGIPPPTLLELGIFLVGALLPFMRWRHRGWLLGGIVLVAVVDVGFWINERSSPGVLRVRFLDVGQGDSTVVELPGGAVLVVDGGGFARSHFDVGERVVARYLRSRRISRVDWLAASHGDHDHQGGLYALARDFAPRELWQSTHPDAERRLARLGRQVRSAGGRVRSLDAGEVILKGDDWKIECLHPPRGEALSSNDASLVLRLSFGKVSLLLTGDVEAVGEEQLSHRLLSYGNVLLKVPHHGSATSSSMELLKSADPKSAVVSVGGENRYGLPAPAVLRRYRRRGVRVWRTDHDGSVLALSRGTRWIVRPRTRASPWACVAVGALC